MDYIFFSDGHFHICVDGKVSMLESKMIKHYENAVEQLRQAHDWKSDTAPIFGDSFMISSNGGYFSPRVNGLASVAGDKFYYSMELEKGGGIYKKSKTQGDDEGFVFTSNDVVPQHISVCGNRMACSLKYPDGTSHIAMFLSERPDYYEFTSGDSIDEYPFIHEGVVFFSSAGIRRNDNGEMTIANKGISRYDIEPKIVTQLFYSEECEYVLPRIDKNGDLYCIRKPIEKNTSVGSALLGLVTAPFWIFAAIVGFVSAFVRIFTGKQLMGKSNANSAKESAKEIIDGCDIDIEREKKRNAKSGYKYPGYAPKSWELIKIPRGAWVTDTLTAQQALKSAQTVYKGVIGYELLDSGDIAISNGSCILSYHNGNTELIADGRSVNRNFTVIDV